MTAVPLPAAAEWQRAESEHFIVYSSDEPDSARKTAEQMERFDALLRRFQRVAPSPDERLNKLTLYLLDDPHAIERVCQCRYSASLFLERPTGAVAFFTTKPLGGGLNTSSRVTSMPPPQLLRSYVRHFLLANFTTALPGWFLEGYGILSSNAAVRNGRLLLNPGFNDRAENIRSSRTLPALLGPPTETDVRSQAVLDSHGWSLTHYVLFDPERAKQFKNYLRALNVGTPGIDAARSAFGDLDQLQQALRKWVTSDDMLVYSVLVDQLKTGPITVSPLTPGAAAIMDLRLTSTAGVSKSSAKPLFARGQKVAASYPDDAVAQGWFAEMAYDAQDAAAAEAAADRALAVDARSSQALLYKSRARQLCLVQGKITDPARWTEARSWIIRANRADPDNASALLAYYQSFIAQSARPSENAVKALYRAQEIVPQSRTLRLLAARESLIANRPEEATMLLRPIAEQPSAKFENMAAAAIRLIATPGGTGAAEQMLLGSEDAYNASAAKQKPAG